MTIKAKRIISDLFDLYVKEPDYPKKWFNFKNNEGKHVVKFVIISLNTDIHAINIHKNFLIFIIFKCYM